MKSTNVCRNEIIALLKFDHVAVSKSVWHVLIKRFLAQFDSYVIWREVSSAHQMY